jgi:hypothetical protein
MEEARLSGSGKENSATTQATGTSHTGHLSRWNSQIDTEDGALGTWALRWEAAEAKSMRECISFTCSLANLTIPSAQVTEDQYVRVLIIFLRFLYKINNLDLQIIKLSLAQLTEVGASVSPPIKQSRC